MKNISLTQRFSLILALFTAITIAVLYLFISAKNEPINFGKQEMVGNVYQRPVEKVFRFISRHRAMAQRALYGDKASEAGLADVQKSIDTALAELATVDAKVGADLQFTEKGLSSRKREHFTVANLSKEWNDLKGKLMSVKPAESNDLHAHMIADLRGMIAHLGDTSNLILDPDLDSYYLMDITLLALPQAQDRIQNVTVELEPIVRRQHITPDERVKASVFVSMMTEADLERIKGDFQTVLNEDPNFYGVLESLKGKLEPQHQKFAASYKAFIDVAASLAEGKPVPVEKFLEASNNAMTDSFDYWDMADDEMDHLLDRRVEVYTSAKTHAIVWSVLCLLGALFVAAWFIRYLVRNMRQILAVLNHSSVQLSAASSQTAVSATQLSEASTEQAASLQETMASIEEISAMVNQNADSANRTREAVEANQKVSDEGSRSVAEMMGSIAEIKTTNDSILTQMQNSNKEFEGIVKIISEIGNKTTVINEIVFQTKLLSFNASVEAARAGEHGKGFAVVAEEVGNLAQMSGNAAKDITDMLSDSIRKVNEIVESTKKRVETLMAQGLEKVNAGQQNAQKCNQALEKITDNARSVTSMIAEIASASKEQALGIQEINKAIGQLDKVTQQNTTVAQQSSNQAENLSTEAKMLSQAINQLVAFVDGAKKAQIAGTHAPPKAEKKDEAKVVNFKQPVFYAKAKVPAPPPAHAPVKQAAGAESPSADDPRFEDI